MHCIIILFLPRVYTRHFIWGFSSIFYSLCHIIVFYQGSIPAILFEVFLSFYCAAFLLFYQGSTPDILFEDFPLYFIYCVTLLCFIKGLYPPFYLRFSSLFIVLHFYYFTKGLHPTFYLRIFLYILFTVSHYCILPRVYTRHFIWGFSSIFYLLCYIIVYFIKGLYPLLHFTIILPRVHTRYYFWGFPPCIFLFVGYLSPFYWPLCVSFEPAYVLN